MKNNSNRLELRQRKLEGWKLRAAQQLKERNGDVDSATDALRQADTA